MIPFRRKYLYTPEMNGSYSLKSVVPAIVPELSYKTLGIRDGGSASIAYEQLFHEKSSINTEGIRSDLLEYCHLDTLSMVKILERMRE
jgi:hypothetical protein